MFYRIMNSDLYMFQFTFIFIFIYTHSYYKYTLYKVVLYKYKYILCLLYLNREFVLLHSLKSKIMCNLILNMNVTNF